MSRAFVAIGSNFNATENYAAALRELRLVTQIIGISTVYETNYLRPDGTVSDTEFFLNGVVAIETPFDPLEFKNNVLRTIEKNLGRTRDGAKNAPRTIDLDLVLYANLVVQSPELTLPSPDIRHRDFVAVPLLELEPNLILPDTLEKLADLTAQTKNTHMKAQLALTAFVRKDPLK
jgi:2-amino-4-hydroxy-6-hydroxymethyldihydropteridine diphosphokinase